MAVEASSLVARSRQSVRDFMRAIEAVQALRQEFDSLTDSGSDLTELTAYFTSGEAGASPLDISQAQFVAAFLALQDIGTTLDASADVALPNRTVVRRKSLYQVASNR